MGKTIELPDPLYAEISGYATRAATSPVGIVRQAWEEFRSRHPQQSAIQAQPALSKAKLSTLLDELSGSISLPSGVDDKTLIEAARTQKYGPV